MASAENLMAGGIPASVAKQIGLEIPATGLTATGTNQAGALVLTSSFSIFSTVSSSTGCVCSSDKDSFIYNGGSNALSVYPPGTSSINGLSASTAISVPANKGVYLVPARGASGVTGVSIAAIVSA